MNNDNFQNQVISWLLVVLAIVYFWLVFQSFNNTQRGIELLRQEIEQLQK